MTFALLLGLAAAPTQLIDALQARAPEGSRVELVSWSAAPCRATGFEVQSFERPGRVAVRITGTGCTTWGWATVRLRTTQAVLTKDVEPNAPLEPAVQLEERDWSPGQPGAPSFFGATAGRKLRAGTVLREIDVRFGPAPGTPVTVRVVVNTIAVEQRGTIIACSGQRVCASLPSGKRLSGTWRDGVLVAGTEGGT